MAIRKEDNMKNVKSLDLDLLKFYQWMVTMHPLISDPYYITVLRDTTGRDNYYIKIRGHNNNEVIKRMEDLPKSVMALNVVREYYENSGDKKFRKVCDKLYGGC